MPCAAYTRSVARRMQRSALRAAADPLRVRCALGCVVALAFALASSGEPALAQNASPAPAESQWGYALADELMSPWCPGFALPDCSSGYAQDLRLWILEQERLGRSEEEVKAEILARYGEKMLQAPMAEGRGIFAYAIPGLAILAGFAVIVLFLRNQARAARAAGERAPSRAAGAGDGDETTLARVDAELARFERAND